MGNSEQVLEIERKREAGGWKLSESQFYYPVVFIEKFFKIYY
jgi:hypothetical protein